MKRRSSKYRIIKSNEKTDSLKILIQLVSGDGDLTKKDILATVTRGNGAIVKPNTILFVTSLTKTRSGNIMRRILRKIAEGETFNLGDNNTLLDPNVVEEIIESSKVNL